MPRKKRKFEEYLTLGYDTNGKRIRRWIGADTKAEFERLKREVIIESEKIKHPSDITFADYARKWVDAYKSSKSIRTQDQYADMLKKLYSLSGYRVKDLTASDLQLVINQHSEHPRTCQLLKLTLNQIFKSAVRDGIVYHNPAEAIKTPTYKRVEKRFLTDDELSEIMGLTFRVPDDLYVLILANTGMRPAEALSLKWADFNANSVTVSRALTFDKNTPVLKSTKTGTNRTIPVDPHFVSKVLSRSNSDEFIFTRSSGGLFTKSAYKEMAKRIIKNITDHVAGTEGVTMYTFRHTFATRLYYNCVAPGVVTTKQAAQIMGHSEEMFIRIYTHIDDNKEQMNILRSAMIIT